MVLAVLNSISAVQTKSGQLEGPKRRQLTSKWSTGLHVIPSTRSRQNGGVTPRGEPRGGLTSGTSVESATDTLHAWRALHSMVHMSWCHSYPGAIYGTPCYPLCTPLVQSLSVPYAVMCPHIPIRRWYLETASRCGKYWSNTRGPATCHPTTPSNLPYQTQGGGTRVSPVSSSNPISLITLITPHLHLVRSTVRHPGRHKTYPSF